MFLVKIEYCKSDPITNNGLTLKSKMTKVRLKAIDKTKVLETFFLNCQVCAFFRFLFAISFGNYIFYKIKWVIFDEHSN